MYIRLAMTDSQCLTDMLPNKVSTCTYV